MNLTELPPALLVGLGAWLLGLAAVLYLVLTPAPQRLPLSRRRPRSGATETSALTQATNSATRLIDKVLRRHGAAGATNVVEQAGVKMRLQDLVLLIIVGSLVAAALGLVVGGPLVGLLLGACFPVGVRFWLSIKTTRRQRAFADQLDDSLQLMASSLRAGHSLLQALASVSREAEEPTAEEFSRIINETRVGRPLGDALEETAERLQSEDFVWVTQAIAINREVGGNLAEVLDGVGQTIRERNTIKRQVKALSAEGKLSAIVLLLLPVGIIGFLSMSNPEYLAKFTQSLIGYGLIAAAVIQMIVGSLWLRKVVSFKF